MITQKINPFGLKNFGSLGKFRSRWEHSFAVYLDELGIKWEFEKHGEPIQNMTDTTLHYIPDFYLPEYGVYVEIVNTMNRRLANKMYCFETQYKNQKFIVFDKQHLNDMFDSKFTIFDFISRKKYNLLSKKKNKKAGIKK